jgi:hypothetical protein
VLTSSPELISKNQLGDLFSVVPAPAVIGGSAGVGEFPGIGSSSGGKTPVNNINVSQSSVGGGGSGGHKRGREEQEQEEQQQQQDSDGSEEEGPGQGEGQGQPVTTARATSTGLPSFPQSSHPPSRPPSLDHLSAAIPKQQQSQPQSSFFPPPPLPLSVSLPASNDHNMNIGEPSPKKQKLLHPSFSSSSTASTTANIMNNKPNPSQLAPPVPSAPVVVTTPSVSVSSSLPLTTAARSAPVVVPVVVPQSHQMTTASSLPPLPSLSPSFIVAYRFERISLKEWNFVEMKIFNIESFLSANSTSFFLIDENSFFQSDQRIKKEHRLVSSSSSSSSSSGVGGGRGMVSLSNELQSRNRSLITSWTKKDLPHLSDFLSSVVSSSSSSGAVSLLDYWKNTNNTNQSSSSSATAMEVVSNNNQDSMSQSLQSFSEQRDKGKGVIVYEITIQIGIVVRKNAELGIEEDCWRLIYLNDLQTFVKQYESFYAFLMAFFPQLIPAFLPFLNKKKTSKAAKEEEEQDSISNNKMVLVRYSSHPFPEPPVQEPPAKLEKLSSYQTIGLLSESTEMIFSR